MSDIAISVEGLGKAYRIGLKDQIPDTIAGAVASIVRAPFRNFRRLRSLNTFSQNGEAEDIIWALKDVSFQVKQGEVIGVIGRNGAGKSTLLKILSRITEPTAGRAIINGRVASLLEVGTGFHPEMTGRENIYMNGTILGMRKKEIDGKFDEIVEFSGVEKFIDTPIKRYSSGMKVRLAFSVAAHLEPGILIIDEVLAVGDQEFQSKCLGKMNDVARAGRTVLFVSHQMAAVESLCSRALLLKQGGVEADGEADDVISRYIRKDQHEHAGYADLKGHSGRKAEHTLIMLDVTLSDERQAPIASIAMGDDLVVSVRFNLPGNPFSPVLGVVIKSSMGAPILGVNNRFIKGYRFHNASSEGSINCRLPKLPLMPGTYVVDLYFGNEHQNFDVVLDAVTFDVVSSDIYGTGKIPPPGAGPVFWHASWSLDETPAPPVLAENSVPVGA